MTQDLALAYANTMRLTPIDRDNWGINGVGIVVRTCLLVVAKHDKTCFWFEGYRVEFEQPFCKEKPFSLQHR